MSHVDALFKNQAEAFCTVIDRLMAGTVDYKALGLALAKRDPKLFLELVDGLQPAAWVREVADNIKASNRVAAIKRIRSEFGWGLKEAKDVSDAGTPGFGRADAINRLVGNYAIAARMIHTLLTQEGFSYATPTFGDVLRDRLKAGPAVDERATGWESDWIRPGDAS